MRWIFRVVTVHFIKIEFKLNKLKRMNLNSPANIVVSMFILWLGSFIHFQALFRIHIQTLTSFIFRH